MGLTSQNRRRREAAKAKLEKVVTHEETTKHTYETLKSLTRSEQCSVAKELGLKGYTTMKTEAITELILNA